MDQREHVLKRPDMYIGSVLDHSALFSSHFVGIENFGEVVDLRLREKRSDISFLHSTYL